MDENIESASQVASTLPTGPVKPMDKAEWVKKYWFNTLQMVTVINPLNYDWPFMVEMRHFMIKAGAIESFPGVIANVYLDQMSKIIAQDDEKLGFMADPALKKIYYDDLIVSVESLVHEQDGTPDYLKNVSQNVKAEAPSDTPPWETSLESTPDVPTVPKPEVEPEKPVEAPVRAENKEFVLEGIKYKMVVAKDDRKMFYKGGRMTSEAEYSRAASLI